MYTNSPAGIHMIIAMCLAMCLRKKSLDLTTVSHHLSFMHHLPTLINSLTCFGLLCNLKRKPFAFWQSSYKSAEQFISALRASSHTFSFCSNHFFLPPYIVRLVKRIRLFQHQQSDLYLIR